MSAVATMNAPDMDTQQALVGLLLPIAATLEPDHWRVFLAVCEENGISLQKLGRITGLGQSAVIRATSILENWSAEGDAASGLLHSVEETAKGYRRQSYLTAAGAQLRDALHAAFGAEHYVEQSLGFHQFLQQELVQHWQQAA